MIWRRLTIVFPNSRLIEINSSCITYYVVVFNHQQITRAFLVVRKVADARLIEFRCARHRVASHDARASDRDAVAMPGAVYRVVLDQEVLGLNVERVPSIGGLTQPDIGDPVVPDDDSRRVDRIRKVLVGLYAVLADFMDEATIDDHVRRAADTAGLDAVLHIINFTVLDHDIIHVLNEYSVTSSVMNLAVSHKCVVPLMAIKPQGGCTFYAVKDMIKRRGIVYCCWCVAALI